MIPFLLSGIALGGFVLLWALLGSPRARSGGVLWTPRALIIGAGFAVIGVFGYWLPWALDAMLAADVVLVALIWLDATLAPRVGAAAAGKSVSVAREPLPAVSVGHALEVVSRWPNELQLTAPLNIRVFRPAILVQTVTFRVPRISLQA